MPDRRTPPRITLLDVPPDLRDRRPDPVLYLVAGAVLGFACAMIALGAWVWWL